MLAVVALYLRSLNETSDAKTRNHKDAGSLTGLWKNRKAFLMVLPGFTAAGSLTFTFTTYMQKYPGEYRRYGRQAGQRHHDRRCSSLCCCSLR